LKIATGSLLLGAYLMLVLPSCTGQTSRSRVDTSDGITLSLLRAGERNAETETVTIVFIPGWSMPAEIWRPQLEALGERYRVIAMDPRAQGESHAAPAGYTAERRATDIKEVLEPLANVLLVGWSLGAIESLQYVYMFGEDKLAGLVLVDSSVGEEPAPPASGAFLQALRNDREKALGDFVRAIFKSSRPESEVRSLVNAAQRLSVEDSIELLSYPFPRTHWRDIVRRIRTLLLYVVTPQFEEQARNLQKNRPSTRVAIFREAGHALFVDEPERFNSLIEGFARSLHSR
jgi:non-heme chloroperoxidase